MKQLLAQNSGCIYQITHAFRDEESGPIHKPEFSLLEWYRVGFTHHDLMAEMNDFLQAVINSKPAQKNIL